MCPAANAVLGLRTIPHPPINFETTCLLLESILANVEIAPPFKVAYIVAAARQTATILFSNALADVGLISQDISALQ